MIINLVYVVLVQQVLTANVMTHMCYQWRSVKLSSEIACNPGVMFNKHMNIEHQVTDTCKSTSYYLRKTGPIRYVLTESSITQVVHS